LPAQAPLPTGSTAKATAIAVTAEYRKYFLSPVLNNEVNTPSPM